MAIEINCVCGKRYKVDEKLVGKRVRCKACAKLILVEELVDLDVAMSPEEHHTPRRPPPVPGGSILPPAVLLRAPAPQHWIEPEIPNATPGTWQTMASNPALLKLHPLVYLRNYPGPLIVLGGWIVIAIPYLLGSYKWIGIVIALLGIAWFLFDMYRMSRKVGHGCVNPAMVVSTSPWRLAIHTDLSTGGPDRPAIKIIRAPLGRIDHGQLRVGSRVAVVALYGPSPEPDAWDDIDETIIPFVTDQPEQVERILRSVPEEEWRDLDRHLAGLDTSKTGIYKLWKSGKDRFTPQSASTIWVVFAFFCALVFIIGLATIGKDAPASPKRPTQANKVESVPATATPSSSLVAQPPVVATPPVVIPPAAPRTPASGPRDIDDPELGRKTPALIGAEINRMMNADRDESLEKVMVRVNRQWVPGRVVKRDGDLAFVHLDNTNRGKWFRADQVRPR